MFVGFMDGDSVRYPFAITDDDGDVLISSPYNICPNHNIFDSENLSELDVRLIKSSIEQGLFWRKIIARNQKNGKSIIIILNMFPSVRTIAAIYTDIDYRAAAYLCSSTFENVMCVEPVCDEKTRRLEAVYLELSRAFSFADTVFVSGNYDDSENYLFYLSKIIDGIRLITGCEAELENLPLSKALNSDFDYPLFTLFLLTVLSFASEVSDERKATIAVSFKGGRPEITASFSTPSKRNLKEKEKEILRRRFSPIFEYIDSVCARMNAPFYLIKEDIYSASIMPIRLDYSKIGLKTDPFAILSEKTPKKAFEVWFRDGYLA